ncbi:MAG TPA: methylmalonyl Co-A mutase-associated GTPase MeaB [Cyclobacteriaceae bacterium]|nr:methylmalonyl Co-A mutase-associated GTPase MeaB [Cyclobacteriaceae bacterium]
MKARLTIQEYATGIAAGDRVILGKALSLIESNLPSDQQEAAQLIEKISDKTGNSIRIGITGVPGVGKSTFIEVFGKFVTDQQKKIAVLTIDPSSQLTKGSILGDKTRMADLSKNPNAFIRPTASGNTLGGVASKTREAILLCEAAGYDVIIIETVGVGQSEVAVKNMVDFFLLLMLAGAGDELQGIKKGIMEMADAVLITKADGDNVKHATEAQAEYQHALHLLPTSESNWKPKVLTCSSLTKKGIPEIWQMIESYKDQTTQSGFLEENRMQQNASWLQEYFQELLNNDFRRFTEVQNELTALEKQIINKEISLHAAGNKLLSSYYKALKKHT